MLQDSNRYYNVNQPLLYPYNYGYYNNDNFAQVNNYRKAAYTPNIAFGQNPIQPATTQNKKSLSGSDVAKGIGILTGIAIACDFLFCKGKHVKQLANGIDDLFKTNKGTSVKTPSKSSTTTATTTTVIKPNVAEPVKPSTTQPMKNPVVETPAPKVTETVEPTVIETVVTESQVADVVNSTATLPVKNPVVETINPKVTEPIRATAREITNVEQLNPNISYQEAHSAKVFADERNLFIRQREYARANGENVVTNVHTEKVEAKIKEVDDLFSKATPLDKDYIVYRGVDVPASAHRPHDIAYVNLVNNCKVGDVIKPDAGYSFVALEKKQVMGNYAKSGLFEIRLPKGSKLIYHDGWEALMPRNAQYKVLEKTVDNNGRINFVLEYIV